MKSRLIRNITSASLLTLGFAACGGGSGGGEAAASRFTLRILNIGADAVPTSDGTSVPAVFAPGTLTVNSPTSRALFVTGSPASPGLEIMAEDGGGVLLAEEASAVAGVESAVAFGIPEGEASPGPLLPGGSYVVEFDGQPGDHFNFATMFVQSNDLFISPVAVGIPLFNEDGTPRSGDITSEVVLWDAGTEANQEPGLGADQAPRQAGPNIGAIEDGVVRLLDESDFPLPPLETMVTITLTPTAIP